MQPRSRLPTPWLLPVLAGLALSLSDYAPVSAQTPTTVRTGSGFAISHSSHIVTNAHVVRECRSVRVLLGTQQAPARVLALDPGSDLAVLQTTLDVPGTIAMRSSPALRLGDSVIAFGFPPSGPGSPGGTLTTGNVSALAGLLDDPRYLQVTTPVQPGSSGGPLLDDGGNLVGVITAKLDMPATAKRTGDIPQTINFAIKVEVLQAFLKASNIAYDVAVTDRQLMPADVGEVAKEASVKIVCVPSDVPAAEPHAAQISPRVDPSLPLPLPAPPGNIPRRPLPVPPPVVEEQIQLVEVRTPYPGTAPALRELDIRNHSVQSVLQITVGWSEGSSAPRCPAAVAAYRGNAQLFASLKAGESTTLTGEFSEQARYFCILSAQFIPGARQRTQPKTPPTPVEPVRVPARVPAVVPVPVPEVVPVPDAGAGTGATSVATPAPTQ